MSNEELQNRINSAKMEISKSKEFFDHIVDATKNPEDVMRDVLEIIKNKK